MVALGCPMSARASASVTGRRLPRTARTAPPPARGRRNRSLVPAQSNTTAFNPARIMLLPRVLRSRPRPARSSSRRPVPLVTTTSRTPSVRRVHQAVPIGRGIGAGPALDHRRRRLAYRRTRAGWGRPHAPALKGSGVAVIMMAVADDQRAVRALRHDQVDAMGERLGPLVGQPATPGRPHPAAAHSRDSRSGPRSDITGAGRRQPGRPAASCAAYAGDAGQAVREKAGEVVPRADDDAVRLMMAGARLHPPGEDGGDGHPAEKDDAVRLLQPRGEAGNGQAGFDAHIGMAAQRAETSPARSSDGGSKLRALQPVAVRAHLRGAEGIERHHRLRPPRVISSPSCSMAISAAPAISRRAAAPAPGEAPDPPALCPVTVTKPKLRTDAPLACASRSITSTRLPRRAAASAWARPTMPAPTTIRSGLGDGGNKGAPAA